MSKVLVIGDPHEPVSHPGYLSFCLDLRDKFQCDQAVSVGDMVDHQAITFHANNPMCPGPMDEHELTKDKLARWHDWFPDLRVCIGNHDRRVLRLAESVNIPEVYIRDYNETWKTEGWKWEHDFIIDDVYYWHGEGRGGIHPAYNVMKDMLMSVAMGHIHSAAGVKWVANPLRRTFGMDTGCGIDVDAWNFAYGKAEKKRPILAAGVIIDGVPQHFIMPCGRGEKYHKSRFRRDHECQR